MKKLFLLLFLFCIVLTAASPATALVYIDINSPGDKRLPIAVQPFTGNTEISGIIKDDLTFTGLFECISDAAQIEKPDQPFNRANWLGIGIELVVKGRVSAGRELSAAISVHDMATGKEVMRKEYSAASSLVRPIAHTIANDIYKLLTGQDSMFRSKIAYVCDKDLKKELCLMDWDGHRNQSIGLSSDIMLTPRWSPDGNRLLYSAQRNHQWTIYSLSTATLREQSVVRLSGLSMAGNFFPDNKQYVFTYTKDGKSDIYVSEIGTSSASKLVTSSWIEVSPTVSPDGKSILFVSNRSGGPQIFISDQRGDNVRRVTFQGSYNTSPAWSPKGDRIAYVSMISGRNQIFTIKPDGSDASQLTDKGSNEDPCFSPDGMFITFTSNRDGVKGIYIMSVNGANQVRITPKSRRSVNSSWSPQ
ncbi:MAG: Tol-Pal system beta propeller repeat protein TolB [Dissulfurispiraceae bacterium]|jgi:TolB protein|nr:Tol-Pal system beta propeller repeat protein TolB [Dissulfurispiraceae bacterium]